MTKLIIRSDDAAGFFIRARDAAQRADQGADFEEKVTLSFKDPQRMFTVLSETRRRLMLEIMLEPKTIGELSVRLHRNRSAMTKDVNIAGKGRTGDLAASGKSGAWHPESRSLRRAENRNGGNVGVTYRCADEGGASLACVTRTMRFVPQRIRRWMVPVPKQPTLLRNEFELTSHFHCVGRVKRSAPDNV